MKLLATTAARVPDHTSPSASRRIRRQTVASVAACAMGGVPAIEERLAELDREWDVERCLETGAASLSLVGMVLGRAVDRRWYLLPAAVAGFLLQHSLQGWCPPLPLLRALGVRTADEINQERYALKALRGDFADVPEVSAERSVDQALRATLH
jgi:hypothetical protein